jgi:hypothetical protein
MPPALEGFLRVFAMVTVGPLFLLGLANLVTPLIPYVGETVVFAFLLAVVLVMREPAIIGWVWLIAVWTYYQPRRSAPAPRPPLLDRSRELRVLPIPGHDREA